MKNQKVEKKEGGCEAPTLRIALAALRWRAEPALRIQCGFLLIGLSMLFQSGCATPKPQAEIVYFPAPPAQARVVHLKSFNSIEELVPRRAHWLDAFLGESTTTSVGTPAGLAYHDDHLYICDTSINAVHDWDLTTGKTRRIGYGTLRKPISVAVGDGGQVFVADSGRGEVVVFNSDAAVVRTLRPPGDEPYRPVSVAVSGNIDSKSLQAGSKGELNVFVADHARHKVDIFNAADGTYVESHGGVGSEVGKFYYPSGVYVIDDKDMIVADTLNSRVQIIDWGTDPKSSDRLKPMVVFGQPGDRYGDMGKPKQLCVGPDDTVFVPDPDFAHVHMFNTKGDFLMLLGGPEDKPGGTPMPAAAAIANLTKGPTIEVDSVSYPTWLVPKPLSELMPPGFDASYFVFVSNTVGTRRLSVFAVGESRSDAR